MTKVVDPLQYTLLFYSTASSTWQQITHFVWIDNSVVAPVLYHHIFQQIFLDHTIIILYFTSYELCTSHTQHRVGKFDIIIHFFESTDPCFARLTVLRWD